MPISSPFHPFSCHCNLTKLDRCCQNQLHDSTSFCLKFTLPLYHKWSISIVLTLPDLQIFFFWKLCLVTFNLRAIKKNRRGLQSHLEKEQKISQYRKTVMTPLKNIQQSRTIKGCFLWKFKGKSTVGCNCIWGAPAESLENFYF